MKFVFVIFVLAVDAEVIRNFYADYCTDKLCPHSSPTCMTSSSFGELTCGLLENENTTVYHITRNFVDVMFAGKLYVLKVSGKIGTWTEMTPRKRIWWSLETEGKLFRAVKGESVIFLKFHEI